MDTGWEGRLPLARGAPALGVASLPHPCRPPSASAAGASEDTWPSTGLEGLVGTGAKKPPTCPPEGPSEAPPANLAGPPLTGR